MVVQVDAERCAGCGQCVWWAPRVFGQGEQGTVVLLLDELPAEARDAVIEAGWACPTGAIMVSEN